MKEEIEKRIEQLREVVNGRFTNFGERREAEKRIEILRDLYDALYGY